MQGEPLHEGHASSAAQAEETAVEPFVAETVRKAAESISAEDEAHDPATVVAGETEAPARQASPSILLNIFFFHPLIASTGFSIHFETSIPSLFTGPFICRPSNRRTRFARGGG